MKLTNEQQKLVEEHHNLIYKVLIDNDWNIEQWYDSAAIGLCNAALKYNPDSKIKFITYAYRAIVNTILKEIKKNKIHHIQTVSYNNTVKYNEEELEAIDVFPSPISVADNVADCAFVEWFFEYMSIRELQICMYRMQGIQNQEISKILGVTRSCIDASVRKMKSTYKSGRRSTASKTRHEDALKRSIIRQKLLDIVADLV